MRRGLYLAVLALYSTSLSGCMFGIPFGPDFKQQYETHDGVKVDGGMYSGVVDGARTSDEARIIVSEHCNKFLKDGTVDSYSLDKTYFHCGNYSH